MFRVSFLRSAALIACAAVAAPGLLAQNNSNSIKLFGPTNVRLSLTTTGNPPNQVIFNSSTVQLSCSASPIQASVSSTADNTGNVITDNYINLTVTAGDSTTGPVNLCQGGVLYDGYYSCFTPYLEQLGGEGLLTGMDPDNYTVLGGLPPHRRQQLPAVRRQPGKVRPRRHWWLSVELHALPQHELHSNRRHRACGHHR